MAQRKLYELYAPKLMAVCVRYSNSQADAEDILQDAFVRIFQYLGQFQFKGSFEGWMRRITVHVALRNLKKKKLTFQELPADYQSAGTEHPPSAFEHLGAADLMKLISMLPAGYKAVFNLIVVEGYNHDEVAEMLDIQPGTSRSQLVKARKMLQQLLTDLHKIAV